MARDGAPAIGVFHLDSEEFETLRELIHGEAGIWLAPSKRVLLESRLSKRVRQLGLGSFADYCAYLGEHLADERIALINCVTTNKTEFFREPHHFEFLRQQMLPALEQRARAGRKRLRIWSAGCSTGEEPYSIAMVVREWLGARTDWDVRILASDIDTNVLHAAALGCYPAERLNEVSGDRRRRWFRTVPESPQIVSADPALQSLITFRRINLIHEPWPIRTAFDVIFCRNVMIYFNRETQARLVTRFSRLLAQGGHLIIGHSESLAWLPGRFSPVNGYPTVYAAPATASNPIEVRGPAAPSLEEESSRVVSATTRARARYLGIGDVCSSAEARVVRTVLGSCVVALIYDCEAGIGGANHFLLPDIAMDDSNPRCGRAAMDVLVRHLRRLGAMQHRMQAKLFGASNVLSPSVAADHASRNLEFARAYLGDAGIRIVAERVGGRAPLELLLFTATGRALVREVPSTELARLS